MRSIISREDLKVRKKLLEYSKKEVFNRLEQELHRNLLCAFSDDPNNIGKELNSALISRLWNIDLKVGSNIPVQISPSQQLIDIFNRSDINRQLLIVGSCGSGRTSTLLELSRELILIAERDAIQPIPIILDINFWEIKRRNSWYANKWLANKSNWELGKWKINSWIADEIESKYGIKKSLIENILQKKLILPLVDDLDKMDLEFQCLWIPIIKKVFIEEDNYPGLVLCSRRDKFPFPNGRIQLNGTLYLQALTDKQIQDYLTSFQPSQLWSTLRSSPELLSIARKPQGLNLIILALKTLSHNLFKTLSSKDQIESLLYDTYLQWQISELSKANSNYERHQIKKWISWLACYLSKNSKTIFSIADLQPSDLDIENEKKRFKELTSRVRTPLLLTLSGILLFWSLYLLPLGYLYSSSSLAQNWWTQIFFLSLKIICPPILLLIILSPLLFAGNKYINKNIIINQDIVPPWFIIYMFFLCIFFYLSIYKSYLLSTIVNWGLIIFALLSVIAFIFISISDGFRKTLVKTIPIVRGFLFFITFVKAILYFGGSLLLLLFSLLIYNVFVVNVDENASDSSKAWKGSKGLTYLFLASASNFLGILAPLLILTFFLGSDLPRLTSIIPDQTLLRPNSLAASFILPSFGLFLGIIGSLNSGEFALTKHRNIRVILGQSDKFPFNYRSFLKNASDCSLILYLREKCRFNLHEIQLYLTRCEINHLKNEIILLDQAKIQSSTPLKLERLHSLLKYWRFDLSILEWLNTTDWSHEDPALQATVISYIAKCTIEVNLRRSQIYLELKNYQASLECLNQLIKFQPKRPNFFALRSKVYAESHQYERAIMDIDKAIELAPNSYEYLMTKGQYFEKSGDRFSGTNYTFDALKHHKTKNKVNLIKAYIRSRKEDYFTALFLTQRIQSEQDTLIKETMIRELVNHWKNQPLTLSFLKAQAQKEQIPSTKKLITTLIRKIGENSH